MGNPNPYDKHSTVTTIQTLNQRIKDLEFSNERLYEALEKMYLGASVMYDCMNTEGALEGARDALRYYRMVRVYE